jgi:tetratricopeptide (TPR) repeat protein
MRTTEHPHPHTTSERAEAIPAKSLAGIGAALLAASFLMGCATTPASATADKGGAPRTAAAAQRDKPDKTIADCTEAIRRDPTRATAWYERGVAYAEQDQEPRAITDFTKAIRLDPKLAVAWSGRASALASQGQLNKALADCAQAMRLDPNLAEPYQVRGGVALARGQLDTAIADLTEAIRLDPKADAAYYGRAMASLLKGEWDKVIADCTESIRLDPESAEVYDTRGTAYLAKGEKAKAQADFKRAKKLGMEDAGENAEAIITGHQQAHQILKLGVWEAAMENGEIDGAGRTAIPAQGRKPVGGSSGQDQVLQREVRTALASVHAATPKPVLDKAITTFTEALRRGVAVNEAYYGRGAAYWQQRDWDNAIPDLTETIRRDRNGLTRATTLSMRGSAYAGKGDLDKAIADYTEALRLNPKMGGVYSDRAAAYEEKGEKAQAEADRTRAKELGFQGR